MTASGLCCDHPRITLRWHTARNGSKGPWWLSCACGAFTDYAPNADAAWALESALSCPSARQLSPAAALPRQSGASYSREVR
jgi:hypothetical protein